MNGIVKGIVCLCSGAVAAGLSTYTPLRWEIDSLRSAERSAAAREAEHDKQIAAALDISRQIEALRWQAVAAARDAAAARNAAQELLKLAQARREKPAKPAPAVPCPSPAPAKPAPAVPCPSPAPAKPAPALEVNPQAVAKIVDAAAMVAAHNRWRAEVGVPGLRWSGKLAAVAQKYADKMAADGCKLPMRHSGSGYGENMYWHSSSAALRAGRPVDAWAGVEKGWYDPAADQCSAPAGGTCGHYTQVVWKNTTEVGCGMAFCTGSGQVWVCNYSPAGNIVGRKPY